MVKMSCECKNVYKKCLLILDFISGIQGDVAKALQSISDKHDDLKNILTEALGHGNM